MSYEVIEYTNATDKNLFREWFFSLNAKAAAKVTTAITRIENGNTSNVKNIVLLLAGGSKQRQSKDIETAKARWADHKARK